MIYDKQGVTVTAFLSTTDTSAAYGYRVDYGGRAVVLSGIRPIRQI